MKTKNIFFVLISIIVILSSIIAIFYFFDKDKNSYSAKKISDKTNKELDYFEDKIQSVIVKYLKDEYLNENNETDWNQVLGDCEKINLELDNIVLDLINLEISNELIGTISTGVNNIFVCINQKDDLNLMNELSELYIQIPKFLKEFYYDENYVKRKELKALIVRNFNFVIQNDWDTAIANMEEIENFYNELIGNSNYLKGNSYNINKIYILIQEYKNTLNTKNYDLLKIKYISIISEI